MKNRTIKPLAAVIGASFMAATMSPLATAGNPFAINELSSGYQLADAHKGAEGKCGEGKCGTEKTEGEGKCGEGKCGTEKTEGEGKCGGEKTEGEGKCGSAG